MSEAKRGILAIILVSCIGVAMLLGVCSQAFFFPSPMRAPVAENPYPEIIQAAKAFAAR